MYEFRNGTARVIDALERAATDPERLQALAKILCYYPEQLAQDIEAAADYYTAFREMERPAAVSNRTNIE